LMEEHTYANGAAIRYRYDGLGRLRATIQPDDPNAPAASRMNSVTFTATNSTFVYDGKPVNNIDIDARARVNQTRAEIQDLTLKSPIAEAHLQGVPDWNIPNGFLELGLFTPAVSHTSISGAGVQNRDFKGFGPQVEWEASHPLVGVNGGHFDLDWGVKGGVLFGRQHVSFEDGGNSYYIIATPFQFMLPGAVVPPTPVVTRLTPHTFQRGADATVPNFEASLGLSYNVGGFTARAGYRWERYFNAIDGGFDTHRSEDRTIDGPYFKLSLGIGG